MLMQVLLSMVLRRQPQDVGRVPILRLILIVLPACVVSQEKRKRPDEMVRKERDENALRRERERYWNSRYSRSRSRSRSRGYGGYAARRDSRSPPRRRYSRSYSR